MKKRDIQTQIGTFALHKQPVYFQKTNCEESSFPVASHIFEQSLSLPLYYGLTFEQIDFVVLNLSRIIKNE